MGLVRSPRPPRVIAPLVAFCLVSFPTYAQYSGGSGTAEDPYQIATAEDLIALGESPEDYDKHFILTADIDLDPSLPGRKIFDKAVIAPDTDENDWWPEFQGAPFTGVFDGDGRTISHLRIEGGDYRGLFGKLGPGSLVSNLAIEAVGAYGMGAHIGALVGFSEGSIFNCRSTGTVSGGWSVGGLVGANYGRGSSITNCCCDGTVRGAWRVGGLVGDNNDGGGITNCYSGATVTGGDYVGGLVGENYDGSITNSYSAGTVNGRDYVGGLAGCNQGRVSNCFWDIETSGIPGSDGGVGLTTTEMMDPEMLGLNGLADDPNWVLDPGSDYPRLAWQGTPGIVIDPPVIDWLDGNGTAESPYEITKSDQLVRLSKASILMDRHFVLLNGIDLAGLDWFQAVIPWFGGIFDGNGHVIRNLHIQGSSHLGLFGFLGSAAEIADLGLQDVEVNGTGMGIGSLAGRNEGTVSNCYSTGMVAGDYGVGGLVGYNQGRVSKSYCTVTVTGDWGFGVGGLVGENTGDVSTSYSSGDVTGYFWVGGLVGGNVGNISTSYSIGKVWAHYCGGLVGSNEGGRVSSCFWDIETSGQRGSDGGVGLTTTEMMDPEMLGLNGLADDPNWVLDPGSDYPRLAWQGTPGIVIDPPVIDWLDGDGTAGSPYEITKSDQLVRLSKASILMDRHFVLLNGIDLAGLDWFQAVIPWFGGIFDGNGHVIRNLHIQGSSHLGLFGFLGSAAEIADLGLQDVEVNGTEMGIGSLAGRNEGTVSNCYSTGMVAGGSGVGGLVGYNQGRVSKSYCTVTVTGDWGFGVGGLVGGNTGDVSTSYSTGTVDGSGDAGGLVGANYDGSITNSYSASTVDGNDYVGGLVGANYDGSITNSYSAGTVDGNDHVGGLVGWDSDGGITSSFWDVEASGQTTSAGGIGKTTAEMQTVNTFLDAGWDFVDETDNGTEDIWWILEGQGYPRLWWEPHN